MYFSKYPGFVLTRYGKLCRHRNNFHEGRNFYTHRSLDTRVMAHDVGMQGQSEAEEVRKIMGKNLYCGFHGKEWARPGKQACFWLV